MKEYSTTYTFKNNRPAPLIVIVEPWADEFTLAPESVLSMTIFHSERAGSLSMATEIDPKYFTVWLEAGCRRAVVAVDGKYLRSFA